MRLGRQSSRPTMLAEIERKLGQPKRSPARLKLRAAATTSAGHFWPLGLWAWLLCLKSGVVYSSAIHIFNMHSATSGALIRQKFSNLVTCNSEHAVFLTAWARISRNNYPGHHSGLHAASAGAEPCDERRPRCMGNVSRVWGCRRIGPQRGGTVAAGKPDDVGLIPAVQRII